jgi:hypothetical protein|tara:strand:+ start:330 stop:620 length:291 start_codon:yes stop_codon:yes gene_type:complete
MAKTLQDIKRNKILNANTKVSNQASSVSEKGSRARQGLANKYLTKAPKPKPSLGLLPMVAGIVLAPTKAGDGTLKEGTIKKAKAEAARKAKRRPAK